MGSTPAVVEVTSRLPLVNLAAREHRIRWELDEAFVDASRWVGRLLRGPERRIVWLDLCSGSGFVREEAIEDLESGAPNGFFFALLLRRLNDWVPQVRARACERILSVARRTEPDFVVDALWCTLPHLASWGRTEGSGTAALLDLLSIPDVVEALRSRLREATAGPAGAVLGQAMRSSALDPFLEELALRAIQPMVRARASETLLEGRATWIVGREWEWTSVQWCEGRFRPILEERPLTIEVPFTGALRRASSDRSPKVRRVAGAALLRTLEATDGSAEIAELLAQDSYPSIAEMGRLALSKLQETP